MLETRHFPPTSPPSGVSKIVPQLDGKMGNRFNVSIEPGRDPLSAQRGLPTEQHSDAKG
jgi:hypothetical protein